MATLLTEMPAIWDTDEELETWTLDGVEVVDGTWQLAEGERVGTATSPVLELDDFHAIMRCTLEDISRPYGQTVLLRVRTAATEEAIEQAAWSKWFGGADADGRLVADLRAWALNEEIEEGAFWQLQVRLER